MLCTAALHDLVAAVVRAEVRAFLERAEQRRFLRVLTEESLAEGTDAGAVHLGDPDVPPPAAVDPDEAVATALLAICWPGWAGPSSSGRRSRGATGGRRPSVTS